MVCLFVSYEQIVLKFSLKRNKDISLKYGAILMLPFFSSFIQEHAYMPASLAGGQPLVKKRSSLPFPQIEANDKGTFKVNDTDKCESSSVHYVLRSK